MQLVGDLLRHLRRGAGVDGERAAAGVGGWVAVDGVRRAHLLADALEQARAHAAAKQVVHHRHGIQVVVVLPDARIGQAHVHLLDVLFARDDLPLTALAGNRLLRHAVRAPVAQIALRHLLERVQVVLPGDGQHGVVRAVVLASEGNERLARDGGNLLVRAQDRAAERMVAKIRLRQQVVDQILRRVLAHGDLLEDDAALLFEVLLVEPGAQEQVGQEVHRAVEVLGDDLRVVAGAFLRGERVHLPADGVHLHGDFARGAPLGALEEHVLHEVRQAVFLLRLIHGARADPQAHAHGRKVRDVFGDHAHAVVKDKLIAHVG